MSAVFLSSLGNHIRFNGSSFVLDFIYLFVSVYLWFVNEAFSSLVIGSLVTISWK